MNAVDLVSRIIETRRKQLKRIDEYLKIIKERCRKVLGKDAEVYVFGSFVRKRDFDPFLSDVDVLVVSDKIGFKMDVRGEIRKKILKGIPSFFELHLANKKYFEYYKFFVRDGLKYLTYPFNNSIFFLFVD